MAWRSPLTIDCYDHSFTEREEDEEWAAFQRNTEREVGEAHVIPASSSATRTTASFPQHRQSTAAQQALADLAFWEDQP
jgi:hypothetical protein